MIRFPRAGCAALALACAAPVAAQTTYPARPVRIVVPSSPGGGLDFIARAVGQHLSKAWGQSVVVDNRAGAGGTLGPDLVAKAPPDGYTLLVVSASFAVNPSVYPKLPYDSVKDFEPIILATTQPQVLVVNAGVPAKSLKELIALAKAKPGALNYASPGAGTLSQLTFELFKSAAGIDIVHVPYKGAGLSMTAVVSGETQTSTGSTISAQPHLKSGKLRALATTGPRRSPAMPDVPTMAEQGLPGATITGWYAFLAPARTAKPVTDKLNADFARVLALPEIREQLAREGSEPAGGRPEQLAKHLATEIARLGRIVKASGAGGQ
ncbi:MAG TPA: tripartite tricarboxylate transporter substrate binding protein [Burkholderiales bacterium]|nr:tripartite tricarboxylate transporter substrate binding protein [Burkholderiales bacterium]